jgi:hypothetical protein
MADISDTAQHRQVLYLRGAADTLFNQSRQNPRQNPAAAYPMPPPHPFTTSSLTPHTVTPQPQQHVMPTTSHCTIRYVCQANKLRYDAAAHTTRAAAMSKKPGIRSSAAEAASGQDGPLQVSCCACDVRWHHRMPTPTLVQHGRWCCQGAWASQALQDMKHNAYSMPLSP